MELESRTLLLQKVGSELQGSVHHGQLPLPVSKITLCPLEISTAVKAKRATGIEELDSCLLFIVKSQ